MNNTGFGCSIAVLILHEENFTSRKYSIYGKLQGLSIYLHIAAISLSVLMDIKAQREHSLL
jgi:hypothetical protein